MLTKIYANYGVLAHEKETVYTTVPHESATLSEPIIIDLPASANPRENAFGEILVDLNETTYLLSEVLTGTNGDVALRWFDGKTRHYLPVGRVT